MKCPNCGKEIANDSRFCEFCGAKVSKPLNFRILWVALVAIACVSAVAIGSYFAYIQHEKAVAEAKAAQEEAERLAEEAIEKARRDSIAKQIEEEDRQRREAERKEDRKKELQKKGFIDLGLPSGTWWKKNSEPEYECMPYKKALKKFGKSLPSVGQWKELIKYCKWKWYDHGNWFEDEDGQKYKMFGDCFYKVTGPNGNYIILKAQGYVIEEEGLCVGNGGIGGVHGYYLSSTGGDDSIWYMEFDSDGYGCYEWKAYYFYTNKLSVQLVQVFEN